MNWSLVLAIVVFLLTCTIPIFKYGKSGIAFSLLLILFPVMYGAFVYIWGDSGKFYLAATIMVIGVGSRLYFQKKRK